jgi:hypothetical protein
MTTVIVEYLCGDADVYGYWIDVRVDREPKGRIGPFETVAQRQAAHDDLMQMMRSQGATDMPLRPQ